MASPLSYIQTDFVRGSYHPWYNGAEVNRFSAIHLVLSLNQSHHVRDASCVLICIGVVPTGSGFANAFRFACVAFLPAPRISGGRASSMMGASETVVEKNPPLAAEMAQFYTKDTRLSMGSYTAQQLNYRIHPLYIVSKRPPSNVRYTRELVNKWHHSFSSQSSSSSSFLDE